MLAVLPTKDVGTIIIAFNREKPSIKKKMTSPMEQS